MYKLYVAALYFIVFLLIGACSSVNKEELTTGDCKFTVSTFSANVQPILQNNCFSCHTGSAPSGGFDMAQFQEIKNRAVSGILSDAINHRGNLKMPYNLPKLSDCDIKKIDAWITAGANEN